ncbi:hypothetical protein CBL_05595 [Carabus blaptoides fortunei]
MFVHRVLVVKGKTRDIILYQRHAATTAGNEINSAGKRISAILPRSRNSISDVISFSTTPEVLKREGVNQANLTSAIWGSKDRGFPASIAHSTHTQFKAYKFSGCETK